MSISTLGIRKGAKWNGVPIKKNSITMGSSTAPKGLGPQGLRAGPLVKAPSTKRKA